jgi:hypothetical protein
MKGSVLLPCTLGLVVAWPALAHARCCSSDQDCPAGFICRLGQDVTLGSCHSRFCLCDSDCVQGMRCLANLVHVGVASTDDGSSGAEFSAGQCLPPWHGPCVRDADCGVGFQCAPASGVGGDSPPTTCTQVVSSAECALDADCPLGWTCENLAAECTPLSGHLLTSYPDQQRCYPPYRNLFDDSQAIYVNPMSDWGGYPSCSAGGTDGGGGAAAPGGADAAGGTRGSSIDVGSAGSVTGGITASVGGGAGDMTNSAGGAAGGMAGGTTTSANTRSQPPSNGCRVGGGSTAPHFALLLVAAGVLARLIRVRRGR